MQTKTLTQPAQKIIRSYLELPFNKQKISCPYFNNQRSQVRAGLRVLIGKGEAKEIVEEATLMALREKIDINALNSEEIKKFLIKHNLGIDCSGLIYHILNAELKAKGQKPLKKHIKRPWIKSPLRKIIAKLRPIENTGVSTLNSHVNSQEINLKNIQPGDMIIMLKTGLQNNLHHILLVHQIDFEGKLPKIIYYTHSFQWRTDGQYGHGVKQGKIEVKNLEQGLLQQEWIENDKIGEKNETFTHAKMAEVLKIRRLK